MKKKISLVIFSMIALFFASCSNDPIEVVTTQPVSLTVSLDNFFSSYNFNDTKHNIKVSEDFRVFNSEYNKYIQVRTLFYSRENGKLVDSFVIYANNTNAVKQNVTLPAGDYWAISTLVFADKKSEESAWWNLLDKDNLNTVKLEEYSRFSKWSLLAVDTKAVKVETAGTVIDMKPSPIGALTYVYYQNFQYKDEASYGTTADNGIRQIAVYSQEIATAYYLNPEASNKYEYKNATGKNSWYFLSDPAEPKDFNSDWTYFKTNLYGYCYILAPSFNLCFGYILKGENTFNSMGMSNYTIENGKMYLAYWDWFQVGNPYFGLADNNHWNTYSKSNAKALNSSILFRE